MNKASRPVRSSGQPVGTFGGGTPGPTSDQDRRFTLLRGIDWSYQPKRRRFRSGPRGPQVSASTVEDGIVSDLLRRTIERATR